ncbi:MAG TPA: manganese efflux pump [Bacillales bacterium]|nr:manganese efflux pump [Bacillales bacterium]
MTVIKLIVLILSLGIDTLVVSISLGVIEKKGKVKIALAFAGAEAVMPLIGLFIGNEAGQLIGNWASIIGGVALIVLAGWLILFDNDDEDERLEQNLVGAALLFTAVSISIDELAVGFFIGLIGVPVILTILLIALQSFVFTMIGLKFGAKIKPYFGEWSEKLAGVILGALGIWILIAALIKLAA